MAGIILTGDAELDKKLSRMATTDANKLAKYALRAGVNVIVKAMRNDAPVGTTRSVRRSIGSTLEKVSDGNYEAKVGVNVGKKSAQGGRFAPHAHLVALGTQPRFRQSIGGKFAYVKRPKQSQLSTGVMPSNPFVRAAFLSSRSDAAEAMRAMAAKKLTELIQKK